MSTRNTTSGTWISHSPSHFVFGRCQGQPCCVPFPWPKGRGGCAQDTPLCSPSALSQGAPACPQLLISYIHSAPGFQVLFLDAGIILASGGIMAVDEATCLQTIWFYILLRGDSRKISKGDLLILLDYVSQERKLREYIQEEGCLPKSLVFRADCCEGQKWKPRDAIFQSSEKAIKEPVSPKPQWSLFTGICPFSSRNGYSWLDVFSALEYRCNELWEKRKR